MSFKIVADLKVQNKRYLLVYYTSVHDQSEAESLIQIDSIGCLVLRPGESLGRSLYFYIDENIANEITLKEIEGYIKNLGSKEKYQEELWKFSEEIGEGQADNYDRVFPEEMWAWKELGIKYPSNIKIVKEMTGFDY